MGVNPAASANVARRTVSADGAVGERDGAMGINPAAVGAVARRAVSADGALVDREVAGRE